MDAIPFAQKRLESPPATHVVALAAFAAATILLIPVENFVAGIPVWLVACALAWRTGDRLVRRNMGILLACVLILGFAPIHTDFSTSHFVSLGIPFAVVVFVPYFIMKRVAPGEMDYRFWPKPVARRDVIYTLISIPLSWGIIWAYFFHLNPELPTHWPLPIEHSHDAVRRLAIGINCVGIWDELFFVNTVYVLLRRLYPAWLANLGQAVVYTSVLYHMAFTGWGIVIVYGFALTQGSMYEKSGVLLWVLIVHLIVDFFLVMAILQYYYPQQAIILF